MEKFSELGLKPSTLKALEEMGFQKPTPIQCEALPLVFQCEDIIGQAKTGTGKTAVFGIYLVDSLEPKPVVQALILVPTRELGVQVANEIKNIAQHSHVKILAIYGGVSINPQIDALRNGVQIVVGTPGRVIDHIRQGTLKLGQVSALVLDEADRMLDMGFIDDVEFIIKQTPASRQTMLFSATMPGEIVHLSRKYQKNPQFIKVSEDEAVTITHITHQFVPVEFRQRFRALYGYIASVKPQKAIIFCNTKRVADSIVPDLKARGYVAESLHGDLSQRQRDMAMDKFRHGKIQILVASDLAARGLDVSDISHIINFQLPMEPLTYTHRVGRTGRAGKGGFAFSVVSQDEMGLLGQIERACGIRMEEINVPLETGFPAGRIEGGREGGSERRYGGRGQSGSRPSRGYGARPGGSGGHYGSQEPRRPYAGIRLNSDEPASANPPTHERREHRPQQGHSHQGYNRSHSNYNAQSRDGQRRRPQHRSR